MNASYKAVQLQQPGGPEVLNLVDLPREPLPGTFVRVRAHAIGVGKPDVLIRKGIYRWMPALPAVPGNELAGEVVEVGAELDANWQPGLRVLVSSRELTQRGGGYAEEICVPASSVFRLPDQVSAADAVALPNYQLAGALLYESGGRAPKSIVVHGAAGGVAVALMQVAQADGVLVIGTASSAAKCAFAQQQGALHVIDRSRQNTLKEVQRITQGLGVDMVLDHVAGPEFGDNLKLLAPLGTLLSYNALAGLPADNLLGQLRALGGISPAVRAYTIHTLDHDPSLRRQLMLRAIELLAAGKIKPPAATVLKLSQAREAHVMLDAGEVLGKLVLVPDGL